MVRLNHGLSLTIFIIPERRAAYVADLATPNQAMFAVVPNFNVDEWARCMGEILDMDLTTPSARIMSFRETGR